MPAVNTRTSNPPGGIIANIGVHEVKVDLQCVGATLYLKPPKDSHEDDDKNQSQGHCIVPL